MNLIYSKEAIPDLSRLREFIRTFNMKRTHTSLKVWRQTKSLVRVF